MPTDISKVGNAYVIGGKYYNIAPVTYFQQPGKNGGKLTINFPDTVKEAERQVNIPFTELTVSGVAPLSMNAALVSLSSVFPQANSGNGGSGNEGGDSVDLSAYSTTAQIRALMGVDTLQGKTLYALGNSFVQNGYVQNGLASKFGVTVTADGVGGSCVTGGTATIEGDGTSRAPIVDRIDAALLVNPDILIIEGGSNDWYYQTAMGDINSTDRNTYYGAWKEIISKCANKNAAIRVVPITLTQRNTPKQSGGATGRSNYSDQELRANAVIEICKMYGIAVLNMFHNSGLTYENADVYTSDGVHPNTAGQAKYSQSVHSFLMNPYGISGGSAVSEPEPIVLTGTSFSATGPATSPDLAFDGDINTFAAGAATVEDWYIGIDLGSQKQIASVSLYPRNSNDITKDRANNTIIQGGNTSTSAGFTNLASVGTLTWDTYNVFPVTGSYRYIRLFMTGDNVTIKNLDIAEIKVMGN